MTQIPAPGARSAAACRTRPSASSRVRTSSQCSVRLQVRPARIAWMWESFSPGITRRPPRSAVCRAAAASGASSASEPTASTRPSLTAIDCASGDRGEGSAKVVIFALCRTRSATGTSLIASRVVSRAVEVVLAAFPHVVDGRADVLAAVHGVPAGDVAEHLDAEAAVEVLGDAPLPGAADDLRGEPADGARLGHDVVGDR